MIIAFRLSRLMLMWAIMNWRRWCSKVFSTHSRLVWKPYGHNTRCSRRFISFHWALCAFFFFFLLLHLAPFFLLMYESDSDFFVPVSLARQHFVALVFRFSGFCGFFFIVWYSFSSIRWTHLLLLLLSFAFCWCFFYFFSVSWDFEPKYKISVL